MTATNNNAHRMRRLWIIIENSVAEVSFADGRAVWV